MIQSLINSAIMAGLIALPALGITVIFAVQKFAHAAHGSFIMLGAYFAYTLSVIFNLNFGVSALVTIPSVGLLAILLNESVYTRLKPYGGLTLMVGSLAVAISIDNLARAIWGPDPMRYKIALGDPIIVMGGSITPVQVITLVSSVSAMIGFHLLLTKTKIGKAWRAYSSNSNLALSSGINTNVIVRWLWLICGSYAALGGILFGMDTQLEPLMGWNILITLFAACILGGIGNPYGAMLGSVVMGFAMSFIPAVNWGQSLFLGFNWYVPTLYKYAIGYVVMIVVLIFRPRGILKGQKGD